MPATRQQTDDDTRKALRPPAAEEGREDVEDSTTLKFDGPVRIADEDAGGDPYNRTGKFKRLVRG